MCRLWPWSLTKRYGSYMQHIVVSWQLFVQKNQILPCIMKSWVSHDSGTHKRKHTQAYTHMDRINSICPLAMLWRTLYCADCRIFHIYAKYCQSISKCFRVTYLNSRVDARVVANVALGHWVWYMYKTVKRAEKLCTVIWSRQSLQQYRTTQKSAVKPVVL